MGLLRCADKVEDDSHGCPEMFSYIPRTYFSTYVVRQSPRLLCNLLVVACQSFVIKLSQPLW